MSTLQSTSHSATSAGHARWNAASRATQALNSLCDTDEDFRPLQPFGTKQRFKRNETIFNEGDEAKYAFRVVSGVVRLCKHLPDGRRQISDFLLEGDFFGFLESGEYSFSAEAVKEAVVICYPTRQIDRAAEGSPVMRKRFLELLAKRLQDMQEHLVMLGRQTAMERVASFLLSLIERSGNSDTILYIPMSRQDIADYLGLTIETVCRALTELKRDRIIDAPNLHQLRLTDGDALEILAEGES